jgi:hypothetical protein
MGSLISPGKCLLKGTRCRIVFIPYKYAHLIHVCVPLFLLLFFSFLAAAGALSAIRPRLALNSNSFEYLLSIRAIRGDYRFQVGQSCAG